MALTGMFAPKPKFKSTFALKNGDAVWLPSGTEGGAVSAHIIANPVWMGQRDDGFNIYALEVLVGTDCRFMTATGSMMWEIHKNPV